MTPRNADIASETPKKGWRARYLRAFGRSEDGSVIILTILLLITMLVLGGMAVDFMRFEARRATLQSVSDRAVLAAASLNQELDSKAVVEDYFAKAGFADAIVGEPIVSNMAGTRAVRVQSQLDINTFYLRLVGINQLEVPAQSAAVEGTGNVEVSLVLDISGSMASTVSGTGRTRMQLLREAASRFVDALLKPEYEDQISMSLVTYSQHVSVGDGIYNALNTTSAHLGPTGRIDASEEPDEDGTVNGVAVYTNPSRCVDFLPSEFATTTFDVDRTYQQVERIEFYNNRNANNIILPLCPQESFEGIIPLTQNGTVLKQAINQLVPTTFTSIHLGMKWGVSLLDPSMRDLLAGVPGVDPVFAGVRPMDYSSASNAVNTVKYVVLMTDGENVAGRRLRPQFADRFDIMPALGQLPIERWRRLNNLGTNTLNTLTHTPITANQNNIWMQQICTAAKQQNMIIFTIAMGAGANGEAQMRACASSPAHYFQTEGGALNDIFDAIARQITDLRLSL
ncbi:MULTISPECIES: Tad domain-containing protein [unclassified Yoonia]|uniref:Tad domain-containing protein n=1 Tax=unclassified Yoonia TaxID=2629118 RepID=UPI002AFF0E63|nr:MULTISPECIES: Tad domain-containing protein [unclassified Yoonia]